MATNNFAFAFLLVFLILQASEQVEGEKEDYYQTLGVSRDADIRDIRIAFKKLALKYHPDKHPDNPKANEKFLKLSRIFDVLKDEDLRSKYDTHGEAGLEVNKKHDNTDDHGYFKSWQFYINMGLYDEDKEITLLRQHDFENDVKGSDDVWFVKFYSPVCSHCHDMAPTWRTVAKELFGVVRIGVINCQEDWRTCRDEGVKGYPTLRIYQSGEDYKQHRTFKDLVDFALKHVKEDIVEIWSNNAENIFNDRTNRLPWIVLFCLGNKECLTRMEQRRLVGLTKGFATVGLVDCVASKDVCDDLGESSGVAFYENGYVRKGKGIKIKERRPEKMFKEVLQLLPDFTELTNETYIPTLSRINKYSYAPQWMIHYYDTVELDLKFRQLPTVVKHVKFGKLNCSSHKNFCPNIRVPSFILFKNDGNYDVHYGSFDYKAVLKFTTESFESHVQSLPPDAFRTKVIVNGEPWVTLFFEPSNRDGIQLISELRRVSKDLHNITKFGTIDCSDEINVHPCRSFTSGMYPVVALFYRGKPDYYQGTFQTDYFKYFVQERIDPILDHFDAKEFHEKVLGRSGSRNYIVNFYRSTCMACRDMAFQYRTAAEVFHGIEEVKFGSIDCLVHQSLCDSQSIQSYPEIGVFSAKKGANQTYRTFDSVARDAARLSYWALDFVNKSSLNLHPNFFYSKVLSATEPWLVHFYTSEDPDSLTYSPTFEAIARNITIRSGHVNCIDSEYLCWVAEIQELPTVRLYLPGKFRWGGLNPPDLAKDKLIQFVKTHAK